MPMDEQNGAPREPPAQPERSEPAMELHTPSAALAPKGPGFTRRFKDALTVSGVNFRSFSKECWRVLRITKKPDKQEFATIVKISGVGILVIGFIGFALHAAKELLF